VVLKIFFYFSVGSKTILENVSKFAYEIFFVRDFFFFLTSFEIGAFFNIVFDPRENKKLFLGPSEHS